jgi:hypothetical protein
MRRVLPLLAVAAIVGCGGNGSNPTSVPVVLGFEAVDGDMSATLVLDNTEPGGDDGTLVFNSPDDWGQASLHDLRYDGRNVSFEARDTIDPDERLRFTGTLNGDILRGEWQLPNPTRNYSGLTMFQLKQALDRDRDGAWQGTIHKNRDTDFPVSVDLTWLNASASRRYALVSATLHPAGEEPVSFSTVGVEAKNDYYRFYGRKDGWDVSMTFTDSVGLVYISVAKNGKDYGSGRISRVQG